MRCEAWIAFLSTVAIAASADGAAAGPVMPPTEVTNATIPWEVHAGRWEIAAASDSQASYRVLREGQVIAHQEGKLDGARFLQMRTGVHDVEVNGTVRLAFADPSLGDAFRANKSASTTASFSGTYVYGIVPGALPASVCVASSHGVVAKVYDGRLLLVAQADLDEGPSNLTLPEIQSSILVLQAKREGQATAEVTVLATDKDPCAESVPKTEDQRVPLDPTLPLVGLLAGAAFVSGWPSRARAK